MFENEEHVWSGSNIKKPVSDISALLFQLNASKYTTNTVHKETLSFFKNDEAQCYLLLSGYASVLRESDRLTLNSESAPFIFGFTTQGLLTSQLLLLPSENAIIRQIPLSLAYDIINQNQAWQALTSQLMYISSRIFGHCERLSQHTAYETVRHLLLELEAEPEAVRQQTSACRYIQNRSYLARSGIARFLAELREGNYIVLENGKLSAINRLPRNY